MQHTDERGSQIIDELVAIVRQLYGVDEDAATKSEKIDFLTSLNSSTVTKIKEYVLQNKTGNKRTSGYSMKFGLQVTWDLLFFLIIFVAIVGNLLVMWIVTGN